MYRLDRRQALRDRIVDREVKKLELRAARTSPSASAPRSSDRPAMIPAP